MEPESCIWSQPVRRQVLISQFPDVKLFQFGNDEIEPNYRELLQFGQVKWLSLGIYPMFRHTHIYVVALPRSKCPTGLQYPRNSCSGLSAGTFSSDVP